MIKLVKYYNSTYIYECALCKIVDGNVIILERGDLIYPYKIYSKIEGLIDSLNYFGIKYELEPYWVRVTPEDELFEKLGFSNEED